MFLRKIIFVLIVLFYNVSALSFQSINTAPYGFSTCWLSVAATSWSGQAEQTIESIEETFVSDVYEPLNEALDAKHEAVKNALGDHGRLLSKAIVDSTKAKVNDTADISAGMADASIAYLSQITDELIQSANSLVEPSLAKTEFSRSSSHYNFYKSQCEKDKLSRSSKSAVRSNKLVQFSEKATTNIISAPERAMEIISKVESSENCTSDMVSNGVCSTDDPSPVNLSMSAASFLSPISDQTQQFSPDVPNNLSYMDNQLEAAKTYSDLVASSFNVESPTAFEYQNNTAFVTKFNQRASSLNAVKASLSNAIERRTVKESTTLEDGTTVGTSSYQDLQSSVDSFFVGDYWVNFSSLTPKAQEKEIYKITTLKNKLEFEKQNRLESIKNLLAIMLANKVNSSDNVKLLNRLGN